MLSRSRWFLVSYSKGGKGDRYLRSELSGLLECKSHSRTEPCTLPGIQLLEGRGAHSRKGNELLETEKECVHWDLGPLRAWSFQDRKLLQLGGQEGALGRFWH